MKPNGLLSEFQTALFRIHKFSSDPMYDANVGNDMRRIFETIKHFYGMSEFNRDTIPAIFANAKVKPYEALFQLVNYYSHGTSEENSDPLPPDVMEEGVEQFIEVIGHEESPFKDLWKTVIEMEVTL